MILFSEIPKGVCLEAELASIRSMDPRVREDDKI